jgi:hypothetical protein
MDAPPTRRDVVTEQMPSGMDVKELQPGMELERTLRAKRRGHFAQRSSEARHGREWPREAGRMVVLARVPFDDPAADDLVRSSGAM